MTAQKAPQPRATPNDKLRKVIQRRIGQGRQRLRLTEKELAKEIGVDEVTIKRWEGNAKPPSAPTLSQARVLADKFGVSLDWLTGRRSDAVGDASSVAAWAEREREQVRLRLDQLVTDLTSAREALIQEARLEAATIRKSRAQQHG